MIRTVALAAAFILFFAVQGCGNAGPEAPEPQDPNAYVKREVMMFVNDIRRAGANAAEEVAMLAETSEYLISEKDDHSPEAAAVIERLGNLANNGASMSEAEIKSELDEIEAAANAL